MSASVFQLIYVSSARRLMDGSALCDLLAQSREKNERLGVTGLLIYAGGNFMQALEGDEGCVRDLYNTIRDDDRHKDVQLVLTGGTRRRDFDRWSMAYRYASGEGAGQRDFIDPANDSQRLKDILNGASPIQNLLKSFLDSNR